MPDESGDQVRNLVSLWLDYAAQLKTDDESDDPVDHPFWDTYFDELVYPSDPVPSVLSEIWWQFIVAAMEHEHGDRSLTVFAGGPLEDLLRHHGHRMIDRIEAETQRSQRFQRAVSGVWRIEMDYGVWGRVGELKKIAAANGNSLD